MAMNPFDSTKPANNSSLSSSEVRVNFNALFNGDHSPLRPRASSPAAKTVYVGPSLIENYWSPFWMGSTAPLSFNGANSSALSNPASSNRIDLLTIDSNGTLGWTNGNEAASPSAPACPTGKFPICYVYSKNSMSKVVNFEESGTYPSDGYIWKDVRPFINPGIVGGPSGNKIVSNFKSYDRVFAGNGADGNATISSNTTLTSGSNGIKVMRYENLTINQNIYLEGNASDKVLVILVKETLTINGTIRMDARGGAGGTWGNPGQAGTFGGGGGTLAADYTGGGGGGENGSGNNGGGQMLGSLRWDSGGPALGVGGNASNRNGVNCMGNQTVPLGFEFFQRLYGAGGGGGNASGANGGKGGGVIWIEAKTIAWNNNSTGLVSAKGANGTNDALGFGGGGGGGGSIQIAYLTKTGVAVISSNGGTSAGGSPGGIGANGIYGEFQVE